MEFNYIFVRRYYPLEGGFRWVTWILPRYIRLTITTEYNCKYLTVQSTIHVNKDVRVGPIYSDEFTNEDILKDLSGEISRRFLN